MITKLWIVTLLGGVVLGIFTTVALFMGRYFFWVDLTIAKIIGDEKSERIVGVINSVEVQDFFSFALYELPLFWSIIFLGVVLFIISFFVKNYN